MGRLHNVFLPSSLICSFLLAAARYGTAFHQQLPNNFYAGPTSCGAKRRGSGKLFSLQTAQVDIREVAPRNYDGYLNWASYYGISAENFVVKPNGNNWGAYSVQPAPAGSRVLFVPAMMRITSQRVRDEEFSALIPMINQYIDATTSNGDIHLVCHFYLFLKVLQEYDLGDQSGFYSWLDAMPRQFSTAVEFDDFEMDCLPPFVKVLARKDKYNFKLFSEVIQALDTPTISAATKSNPVILKWAFNVVFTRARAAYGEAEIIPMSDMMNHASNPNVDVQYDGEGNVHCTLTRDVQPGEKLRKCYGQPTNPSRFLATYGFLDTTPPATYCKLLPGLIVTPELKNLGFDDQRLVFYVENGGIAQEVWDVMLYMVLENIDPAQQQQFYDAHMRGDETTKATIHQYYTVQTCNGLLEHVENMLTEIADCEKTMDAGGMGLVHENLPLIRRHNDFVRQTFTKVRNNLLGILTSQR